MLAEHEADRAAHGIMWRVPMGRSGTLAVTTGVAKLPIDVNCSIVGAIATVGTSPTGTALIIDVKKNGTSIYTTTANRPTIAISGTSSANPCIAPDVNTVAPGDFLTVDIFQVGSTVAGSDLTVVLYLMPISAS